MKQAFVFPFEFNKFVAALTFLAANVKNLSKLPAAKLLYFADRYHLTHYARPVIGDQYVKMEYGPVPSKALDWMNDLITPFRVKGYPRPGLDLLQEFLSVESGSGKHPTFRAKKDPDYSVLSESDLEALRYAVNAYGRKSVGTLITAGHDERAWNETPDNAFIDYRLLFDESDPEQLAVLEYVEEQQENRTFLEELSE